MWRPDQAALVGLAQRSDRRAAMGDLSAKVGVPVSWEPAVDNAGEVPEAVPDREWHSSLGGWGNMLSHRRILEAARGHSVVVFEDDADVPDDFAVQLDAIVTKINGVDLRWEAVYLGGEHMRVPREVAPGIGRVRFTIRTHAYLLLPAGVEVALEAMATCTEHWDVPLAEALAARGHTYAPIPLLVGNTGLPGDIPDSIPIGKYT